MYESAYTEINRQEALAQIKNKMLYALGQTDNTNSTQENRFKHLMEIMQEPLKVKENDFDQQARRFTSHIPFLAKRIDKISPDMKKRVDCNLEILEILTKNTVNPISTLLTFLEEKMKKIPPGRYTLYLQALQEALTQQLNGSDKKNPDIDPNAG